MTINACSLSSGGDLARSAQCTMRFCPLRASCLQNSTKTSCGASSLSTGAQAFILPRKEWNLLTQFLITFPTLFNPAGCASALRCCKSTARKESGRLQRRQSQRLCGAAKTKPRCCGGREARLLYLRRQWANDAAWEWGGMRMMRAVVQVLTPLSPSWSAARLL